MLKKLVTVLILFQIVTALFSIIPHSEYNLNENSVNAATFSSSDFAAKSLAFTPQSSDCDCIPLSPHSCTHSHCVSDVPQVVTLTAVPKARPLVANQDRESVPERNLGTLFRPPISS